MKVMWRRQDLGAIRMPSICAVTGQPAEAMAGVWFGKQWAMFLPGVARSIVNLTNRPVMIKLPVSGPVQRSHNTNRKLSLLTLLAVVLAFVAAIALRGTAGSVIFLILLLGGFGWMIFVRTRMNIVRSDVDGDWLIMNQAAPQFAAALASSNPPGMVQVIDNSARGQLPRPNQQYDRPSQQYGQQQAYGQQPQQYGNSEQYGTSQRYGQPPEHQR